MKLVFKEIVPGTDKILTVIAWDTIAPDEDGMTFFIAEEIFDILGIRNALVLETFHAKQRTVLNGRDLKLYKDLVSDDLSGVDYIPLLTRFGLFEAIGLSYSQIDTHSYSVVFRNWMIDYVWPKKNKMIANEQGRFPIFFPL